MMKDIQKGKESLNIMSPELSKIIKQALRPFYFSLFRLPIFGAMLQKMIAKKDFSKKFRNEILLLKGRHKNRSTKQSILYFGVHRSGTCQAGKILSLLAQSQGMTHIDYDGYVWSFGKYDEWPGWRRAAYKNRGYFLGPLRHFNEAGPFITLGEYQIILQLRDPRDVLVSRYFSEAYGHPPRPNADSAYMKFYFDRRERLRRMTIDEFVLEEMEYVCSNDYMPYCENLLNKPNVLFLEYEEMVTDFTEWLNKVIRFLDFDVGQKMRDSLIQKGKVLLTVKEENIYAHCRQIKPGDHRRKLKKETIDVLTNKFQKTLDLLGYHS